MTKHKVFFFHYNKPASRKANCPKLTLHYQGTCHIVDHIRTNVEIYTHHNKRQPHVVLKGKAKSVTFQKEKNMSVAIIN